jgi:hypothetical protein
VPQRTRNDFCSIFRQFRQNIVSVALKLALLRRPGGA